MKKGEIVTVMNHTLSGAPCIEGKAKLIKPMTPSGMDNGQLWEVQFISDNEVETVYRWIKP